MWKVGFIACGRGKEGERLHEGGKKSKVKKTLPTDDRKPPR